MTESILPIFTQNKNDKVDIKALLLTQLLFVIKEALVLGVTSRTAGNLFGIAGIIGFAEVGISLMFYQNSILALIGGVFGVFFIAAAIFAYRGTMVPIYAKDAYGHDIYSQKTGEYEAACYCGLLGPLAIVIAFVGASMAGGVGPDTLPIIIPGVLGGLIATTAGLIFGRKVRKHNLSKPKRTYY